VDDNNLGSLQVKMQHGLMAILPYFINHEHLVDFIENLFAFFFIVYMLSSRFVPYNVIITL